MDSLVSAQLYCRGMLASSPGTRVWAEGAPACNRNITLPGFIHTAPAIRARPVEFAGDWDRNYRWLGRRPKTILCCRSGLGGDGRGDIGPTAVATAQGGELGFGVRP